MFNSSIYVYAVLGFIMMGSGRVAAQQPGFEHHSARGDRGAVITFEKMGTLSVEEVTSRFAEDNIPGIPRYGTTLYRITYGTVDHKGEPTIASGALAVPLESEKPAPLLSFQHGTVLARHRVPSVKGFDLVSMGFGSSGYVTVLPDYLGLGESSSLHPYVHAESLANTVIDMLRAAREVCKRESIDLNEQLFLVGYSEGGFATMAAHKMIEHRHSKEFTVTASAPMAGPYNLSGVMVDQILADEPYPSPGYLPYTLLAYDMVYDIYERLDEVLETDYADLVEELFDGETSLRNINPQLPSVPREMLTSSFIEDIRNDPNHPLREALRENDVHNWKPVSPMRLYHCVDDDQVSFRNAEMALRAFQDHGADHVELAKLTFGDHNSCAPRALFLGKLWFDGFVYNNPERVFQANAQIIKAGAYD